MPLEIGLSLLGAPSDGLYLRIDVELSTNIAIFARVRSQVRLETPLLAKLLVKKLKFPGTGSTHNALHHLQETASSRFDNSITSKDSSTDSPRTVGISKPFSPQDSYSTESPWPKDISMEIKEANLDPPAGVSVNIEPHKEEEASHMNERQPMHIYPYGRFLQEETDQFWGASLSLEKESEGRDDVQKAYDKVSRTSSTGLPEFFTAATRLLAIDLDKANEQTQGERLRCLAVLAEMRLAFSSRQTPSVLAIRPVERKTMFSFANRFKIAIESSTGSEWTWWPLSTPVRWPKHCEGATELSWQGVWLTERTFTGACNKADYV